MQRSEQINELAAALAKAQGAMKAAELDRANPFFKSKYATLASIWTAARIPLSMNGLSVAQVPDWTPEGLQLTTMLMHSSGQYISNTYPINPIKDDPQGIGSALSYARRYTLAAMIGATSDEDDDGNEASQPARQNGPQRQQTPVTQQPPAQRQTRPESQTDDDAPKLAAIRTPKFGAYATTLADKWPKYRNQQGSFDAAHIQASIASNLKVYDITDANIDAIFAKLHQRAIDQANIEHAPA